MARKLASLLALLFLAGLVQTAAQSPDEHPTIRGTVVNAVTQAPIPRALVYSPDNRFATLTDGEGHFEFSLPDTPADSQSNSDFPGSQQRGPYQHANIPTWLYARKPGFVDGPDTSHQVLATPDTETTIALVPEALITGRITTSTSEPAVGINVQLFSMQVVGGLPRWISANSVLTNSQGEFRFAELQPGAYKLLTREWMDNDPATRIPGSPVFGFPPVYYPGGADFTGASTIQLAGGQTSEADLSLTSQQYYNVTIPVANGDASGAINVRVRGQRGPGFSLGYNAGTQKIEGLLPNGNYVVEATSYGQPSATGIVNLRVAGAPVEGPAITLIANGSINVNVKEEFSDANWHGTAQWGDGRRTSELHGARAYRNIGVESVDDVEQQAGGTLRSPSGPNDNSLVIENLPPGRYRLQAPHPSRGYVASATSGDTDLLHEPFSVGAGTNEIQITMRDDFATLDGSITNFNPPTSSAEGDSVIPQQAWVYFVPSPESTGQYQEITVSGDDGKFSFQLAPGTYRVLAFSRRQRNLPYRDAEAMRAYDSKGSVIHLVGGEKASVQVQIISGVSSE